MDARARRVPYVARVLQPGEARALDTAFRLRHTVFVGELGWVSGFPSRRERDRCDALATHFAVFAPSRSSGAQLVGYARVLLPADELMLQREFAALVQGQPRDWDPLRAFEVSRFVVHRGHRGQLGPDRRGVVEHLARAIAAWALAHGRSEWVSVCEVRHLRALHLRGLPFVRFGRIVEYQPGVPVCAARLDLAQAAARLRVQRPRDYAWYVERMQPPC